MMLQKRKQKFHHRQKDMLIIWSAIENKAGKTKLQKLVAISSLSKWEKAKLRISIENCTRDGFVALAAKYLAKYVNY